MKLLIVSQYFWPENFGINQVANDLMKKGVNVEVLTGMPNYPLGIFYKNYGGFLTKTEVWNNIKIHRLPISPRGNKSKLGLIVNYLSFIFSGIFLGPLLLRKTKYDVIFVYGVSPIFQCLPAAWLGKLKNIPVVLWVQDLWPESVSATGYIKSKKIQNLLGMGVRFCYAIVDMILVQSHGFLDSVKKLSQKKEIYYLPNSVDKSFFEPDSSQVKTIESMKNGFSILFAGNIGSAQAMNVIVGAAERLRFFSKITFVIMGAGSKLSWLESEVAKLGLTNIKYEGNFPITEMPNIMRQASALLVTLANEEIFALTVPNKIQAYLAVGRPIIASLNGEGANLVEKAKAGFTAPAEDIDSLVNVILKMSELTQPELDEMGGNGRQYFKENFDNDVLVDKLINYLNLSMMQRLK